MSPLSLSGLASGLDTESIISQLMSVEQAPKTRMQQQDTQAQARQTKLRDLATKLNAVRDAATPLLAEDATHSRAGADAAYTIDGAPKTSTSNVITDAVLGVEVTLKSTTTGPVSVGAGDPGVDTDAIKAKVTAFVNAYNSTVD